MTNKLGSRVLLFGIIVTAVLMVLTLTVLAGVLIGKLQPAAETKNSTNNETQTEVSAHSEVGLPAPRSQTSSTPTQPSPAVMPTGRDAAPVVQEPAPLPTKQDPPATIPAPAPAPAITTIAPSPSPTCPADAGVSLSIDSVDLVYEGHAMDEYRMRLSLTNRVNAPVSFRVIDSIKITSVRADGAETTAGFVTLENTYEIQPGTSTIVVEAPHAPTTYHGFGSPVVMFKLSGKVWVTNSYPDQLNRSLFCEYRDVAFGTPIKGSWGS
ncbi:hypothetical protein [Arthrobacter sp. SW1]|uniref:hypothetical protein n=1 Tax=Arthrobacter sp. SW1 TaxID=1920889 RepID=UPI001113030C|nr:hypothetical protein [Arthrobacter sp. SW1]